MHSMKYIIRRPINLTLSLHIVLRLGKLRKNSTEISKLLANNSWEKEMRCTSMKKSEQIRPHLKQLRLG